MKRTDLTWAAILVLLIAASAYEAPSVVGSLRDKFNRLSNRNTEGVVPDEVAAEDPEAAAVLRYHLDWTYSETIEADLAALVKKYPENAYLLSEYAVAMARHPLAEVLPLVDRLQNMDPNNAYYQYVRGYVLLAAEPPEVDFQSLGDRLRDMDPNDPFYQRFKRRIQQMNEQGLANVPPPLDWLDDMDPNDAHYQLLCDYLLWLTDGRYKRVPEALHAFARGHDLPRLTLPYVTYKSRVDLLARKAQLSRFHRRTTWRFTWKLNATVGTTINQWSTDREQRRDLIDSTARIADRLMENAWDMDSLCNGADLARHIEETRLKEFDLTETEAWQARLRLSQAIATDDFSWSWERDCPVTRVSFLTIAPTLMFMCIAICTLTFLRLIQAVSPRSRSERSAHAVWAGLCALIAVLVFLAFYQVSEGRSFLANMVDSIWTLIAIGWFGYAEGLSRVAGVNQSPQRRRWIIGFGLLVVNGLVLLLIGNSRFLWDRSLVGWSDRLAVFGVWLLFCLLLWFATSRRQLAFARFHHMFAVTVVVSWAGFLLICDVAKNRGHYERRAHAEPLSVCGPLPAATEQTYNRVIRDAPWPRYADTYPYALPEYVEYLTPADFEALLARRRDEGHPMTKFELRRLMDDSARDLRPIIEKERELLNAATPSPPAS